MVFRKIFLMGLLLPVLIQTGATAAPEPIFSKISEKDFLTSISHMTNEQKERGTVNETGATRSGAGEPSHGEVSHLGQTLPLWSVIPFVGILLSIALFPLIAPHFWHRRFPVVSAAWALIFAVPFLWAYGHDALHEILHIYFIDYIPFIILLWSLFTVSGGIVIRGTMRGTPKLNTLLILIGTAIASWIGTTGAAMVMIRPLMRANAGRRHRVHTIVFFIFLVANIGGSLTPLGDPPLFLGFLHSVPFFWTMHLLPHMLFVVLILLVGYYLLDSLHYRREDQITQKAEEKKERIRVSGLYNLIFLAGILSATLISGVWHAGEVTILGVHMNIQDLFRGAAMLAMGALSLWVTPWKLRRDNEFTWVPIKEVAYLFAGIFMTIIPALAMLRAGAAGNLGFLIAAVQEPWQYFWVTGILSSFLDNAPTYLTFFNTCLGTYFTGIPESQAVLGLISEKAVYLEAIAAGAVFMGANTYIGNAPNFMVKSIAEEGGIPMPSFFGFILKYSLPILIPIFVLVTLIFF